MKIAIITVAVNCLEYSKKTIASIQTKHEHEIIFVNNGSTDGTESWLSTQENIIAINNPVVSGLSGCWNLAIQRAINDGCDLFFVINNDIVLAKNTIDNLVKKIESDDFVMVTGVNDQSISPEDMINCEKEFDEHESDNEHPDFSCFMININCIDRIGWFDENYYTAYFEDNDYHARIALAGERAVSTTSATYYHYGSKTVQGNPEKARGITVAFEQNREYFRKKWGILPLGDVPKMRAGYFPTPFNQPDKTIKDVRPNFTIDSLRPSVY